MVIQLISQNPEDPLSFASAWLALLPQALCVSYVTLVWASREIEVILMFAGQLGCEAVNFVLKRIIKEERPRGEWIRPQSSMLCLSKILTLLLLRNVRQRLRHAVIPRPVYGLFCRLPDAFPRVPTQSILCKLLPLPRFLPSVGYDSWPLPRCGRCCC